MANQHTYDEAFQLKVVKDYLSTNDGYEACGKRHNVSKDTVWRWVKKYRHQIEYGIFEFSLFYLLIFRRIGFKIIQKIF